MRCPSCGTLDTQVKDSRPTEDSAAIRRRRVCLTCNFRFTTFERVQLRELVVIKRNGRRVPFDRDKLMRSLSIALRKRPVEPERVEQMVSKIVRELESLGESEITSETIGEAVMEHLRKLDDVAYVRFASVYRNFREPKDFEQALAELSGEDEPKPSRPSRRSRAKMSDAAPAQPTPRPPIPRSIDERFMQLALALGRRGLGRTWPNPAVGAVIVKDGVILGRGWTQPGGRPHAETEALKRAGKAAKGATLYVTLEPCSHQGKTPPCADAIIRAGIARVVSALEDPNPEVAGQGYAQAARARHRGRHRPGRRRGGASHAGHIRRMREGRPQVLLKLAVSADGKAGLRRPQARRASPARRRATRVHQMRARSRRHPGRHRHGAVRRSASDLPAAGHDRAVAGARRARRQAARAAGDLGRRHRARDADLGVRRAGRVAGGRGHFAGRRASRCSASTARTAGSISRRCSRCWPGAASPG